MHDHVRRLCLDQTVAHYLVSRDSAISLSGPVDLQADSPGTRRKDVPRHHRAVSLEHEGSVDKSAAGRAVG